jgi:hypothetical protein
MQQLQAPLIFHSQTVAVPFTDASGSLSHVVMTLDIEQHPTDLREGFVTIDGRRGWVVQSYPPVVSGACAFFLYQWLDQPGISAWNNGR